MAADSIVHSRIDPYTSAYKTMGKNVDEFVPLPYGKVRNYKGSVPKSKLINSDSNLSIGKNDFRVFDCNYTTNDTMCLFVKNLNPNLNYDLYFVDGEGNPVQNQQYVLFYY